MFKAKIFLVISKKHFYVHLKEMFRHSRFDYKDNREAEETETELKRVVNDQQKQISNLRAQVSCWEAWPAAQNLNRVWKYLHKCWWRSRAAIQILSGIASCTKFAQSLFLHSTKDCTCRGGGADQWSVAAMFPVQYNICTIGGGRSEKPSSSTLLVDIAQCLCRRWSWTTIQSWCSWT